MSCPDCSSINVSKNGKKKGKQNYICQDCRRQFIDRYDPSRGYPNEVKRECLEMYVNAMRFRSIERVKKVHHTTVIYGVKQLGEHLPDVPENSKIPEVGELDELHTFVGSKKQKGALDGGEPLYTGDFSLGVR
jgi:transposase-like protein